MTKDNKDGKEDDVDDDNVSPLQQSSSPPIFTGDLLESMPPMPTSLPPPPPTSNSSTMEEISVANTSTSKDVTHLISISNEHKKVGDAEYDDDDVLDSSDDSDDDDGAFPKRSKKKKMKKKDPFDCLFGGPNFCPIGAGGKPQEYNLVDHGIDAGVDDDNENDNNKGEEEDEFVNKVQRVVSDATASVRGALDEHVKPKMDDATKQFENVRRKSIESFNDASARTMEKVTSIQSDTMKFIDQTKNELNQSKSNLENKSQELYVSSRRAVIDRKNEIESSYGRFLYAMTVEYRPYYEGTAPGYATTTTSEGTSWFWLLEEGTLRSFGKVVFCDNPVTGILIWLGIVFASPASGLCAILGALMANITALYLQMDKNKIKNGQYGRNAVLIGPSIIDCIGMDFPLTTYHPEWPLTLFMTVMLSLATLAFESVWISYHLKKFRWRNGIISSLLLPYNIALLVTLLCAKVWNAQMTTQVEFINHYETLGAETTTDDTIHIMTPLSPNILKDNTHFLPYRAVLNGMSRIFFVDGIITGVLILIGVAFCSRILVASMVLGALVSSFFVGYAVFHENYETLNSGYVSLNPALAVAGIFYFFVPSYKLLGLASIAIAVTVIVTGAVDVLLKIVGLPVSTSIGFCIVLLPMLSMDLESMLGHGHFIRRIPESELSTPEGHIRSIRPLPSSSPPPSQGSSSSTTRSVPTGGVVDDDNIGAISKATEIIFEGENEDETETTDRNDDDDVKVVCNNEGIEEVIVDLEAAPKKEATTTPTNESTPLLKK